VEHKVCGPVSLSSEFRTEHSYLWSQIVVGFLCVFVVVLLLLCFVFLFFVKEQSGLTPHDIFLALDKNRNQYLDKTEVL
jgi:hypothetical protein